MTTPMITLVNTLVTAAAKSFLRQAALSWADGLVCVALCRADGLTPDRYAVYDAASSVELWTVPGIMQPR